MARTPKNKAKRTALSEKQTALNREYKKQVDRIKKFIKRGELRGYHFISTVPKRKTNKITGQSEVVVPTDIKLWELPKKPKKITEASIRKLKEITPDYLYSRSLFSDPTTDELLTGQEGRQMERRASAKKAAKTRKRRTVYTETDDNIWDISGTEEDRLLEKLREMEDEPHDWYDDKYDEIYYEALAREKRRFGGSEIPEPPSGQAYDYIFESVEAILSSLAPAPDRYTKKGLLWSVDETRLSWSNALTGVFNRIKEEHEAEGTSAEYAMYLSTQIEKINEMVEQAKKSSKPEAVAANCEAILKILNEGNALLPHEEDAVQRYIMGEIDEI